MSVAVGVCVEYPVDFCEGAGVATGLGADVLTELGAGVLTEVGADVAADVHELTQVTDAIAGAIGWPSP